MKLLEVVQQVEAIEACKDDYERAHGMEDYLYREVLEEIAGVYMGGVAGKLGQLARAALRTQLIKFSRHCA